MTIGMVETDTSQRGAEPHWSQGLLLASVPAMYVMTLVVVIPIIPKLFEVFASDPDKDVLVPMAVVVPMLALALSSIPAGFLGERIGRRLLLEISTAIFAVSAIAPFWFNDLYQILACRAVTGVALGAMMTCSIGLIGDYYSDQARQRWLSLQGGIGGGVGVVISAVAGVLGDSDWRYSFLLLAAGFVLLAALLILRPPSPTTHAAQPTDDLAEKQSDAAIPWNIVGFILGLSVVASLVLFPPAYALGLILDERELGAATIAGIAVSILTIGSIFGAMGIGLLQRYSAPAQVALAFFVVAVGMSMISLPSAAPIILAGAGICGVGQGMIAPILSGWLLQRTPALARGQMVGVYTTAFFAAQFAAPLVAGQIAIKTGGATSSMVVYAIVSAVSAVLILIVSLPRTQALAR